MITSEGAANSPPASSGWNARVDGILNIDKPLGMTSMDVVRRIKRASRQKRVGHGGTLDPIASGALPICLGQATRMMEYLINGTREYRSTVELGAETDTYDAFGEVTGRNDPSSVTLEDVERALGSFEGKIEQVPPMYSALKRQGKRLYHLARAGIQVEREPRKVEVLSIELIDWSPPCLTVDVTCGRGFYMRSLAHDLGQVLRCGGHMKALVRLRSGPFTVSDAMTLADAEQKAREGAWQESLYAPDVVVGHMSAAIVGTRVQGMLRDGLPFPPGLRVPCSQPEGRCRVYGADGRFVGIISFDASLGQWQPEKVFSLGYSEKWD